MHRAQPRSEEQVRSAVVLDRAAAYREGLGRALQAHGFHVPDPDRPEEWLAGEASAVVAVSIRDEEDWNVVAQLAGRDGVAVIALLPDLDPREWGRALLSEVAGVADWSAPASVIASTIAAATNGEVHMPRELVRRMIAEPHPAPAPSGPDLDQDEVRWLAKLAAGVTVRTLHEEEHLSERVMYRRLQNLYVKLGAHNRHQAVAAAARHGFIE